MVKRHELGEIREDFESFEDVEFVRLNKHTATIEHLERLKEHIQTDTRKCQVTRLEVAKVLFTEPKAVLLADIMSHPNCKIKELVLTKCRAKSDKMTLLFGALARNKSVANLILTGTNIPRDSVVALNDLLSTNK